MLFFRTFIKKSVSLLMIY